MYYHYLRNSQKYIRVHNYARPTISNIPILTDFIYKAPKKHTYLSIYLYISVCRYIHICILDFINKLSFKVSISRCTLRIPCPFGRLPYLLSHHRLYKDKYIMYRLNPGYPTGKN